MSKEAIRQIKETEAQAEKIRLDAAAQAKKLIAEAEQQADELRTTVREDARKALTQDLTAMRKKSQDLTDKNRSAAKGDAASIAQAAQENMAEAVKLIIREVTEI